MAKEQLTLLEQQLKYMITRNDKRKIRHKRVRAKIKGTRLCVFRSNQHIYAQLIDDSKGICVTGASSLTPEIRQKSAGLTKSDIALLVGQYIADKAKEKGIEEIVFDRHGYRYQGRLKSLAEGARKGGLNF